MAGELCDLIVSLMNPAIRLAPVISDEVWERTWPLTIRLDLPPMTGGNGRH